MNQLSASSVGAVLLATPPTGTDDTPLWSSVAGRPLLAWPLAALCAAAIGPVALVVPQSRLADAERLIAAEGHADTYALALPPATPPTAALDLTSQPPRAVREGDAPRRGVRRMPSGDGVEAPRVIVLHDALRPLVTAEQIEKLVMAAAEAGIAVGAEPVKETIKRVAGGRVVETLSRDELALLIPPLAVRAGVLPALVSRLGRSSRARIMDYVAVARGQGITVRSVELTGPSLVVTSSEDLALAEALLSRTPGSVIG